MDLDFGLKDLIVFIPLGLVILGFIYVNFVFPRKVEKEEKEERVKREERAEIGKLREVKLERVREVRKNEVIQVKKGKGRK